MATTSSRLLHLLRYRPVRRWWTALALVGVALTWAPLLQMPGYELATGLCLNLTFLGSGLALAATHAARANFFTTTLALISATVPALLVAFGRTAFFSPCDPLWNFGFAPVLVIPTALLVAGTAFVATRITTQWWQAQCVYFAAVAVSAGATLWPIFAGPQIFAFNHFGGYLPGPLYDEAIALPASLLWFRLATVSLALGLSALVQGRRLIGLALLGSFIALENEGTRLGFRSDEATVSEALGGRVEVDELVLHYPMSLSEREVARTLEDLRFRHHQVSTFLGHTKPIKVHVWLYASAEDKQRLVGAAHTQFAKPWRHEVHLNRGGFPHPVAKHELVHALAANWGSAPFGVTASWGGLFPHVGIIEGMAVAADNPIDGMTLHESAAAMKRKRLLPNVAHLMTSLGFYQAAPSRAYTAAGSFLRFLQQEFGAAPLQTLYREGDFEAAFNQSLPSLAARYESFLDAIPLKPEAVDRAFAHFRRPSLFERHCAREVSRLATEARALLGPQPVEAQRRLARCRLLQPEEPSFALAQAQVLRRLTHREEAQALLDAELQRLSDEPVAWAEAALTRADWAAEDQEPELARRLWQDILTRTPSPTAVRTAWVRLDGGDVPQAAEVFQKGAEELQLLHLTEALTANPDSPSVHYLLGRKLAQAGDAEAALEHLKPLLQQPLPPAVLRETARLAVEAATQLGACDFLQSASIVALQLEPAWAGQLADWEERCQWSHGM